MARHDAGGALFSSATRRGRCAAPLALIVLLLVCALRLGLAQPLHKDARPANETARGSNVCGCAGLKSEYGQVLEKLRDLTWSRDMWQQRATFAEAVIRKMPGRQLRYKAQLMQLLRENMQKFRDNGASPMSQTPEIKGDLRESLVSLAACVLLLQAAFALIMLLPMPSKIGGRQVRQMMRSWLSSLMRRTSVQIIIKGVMVGDFLLCLDSFYIINMRTAPQQIAENELAVRACKISALQLCIFGILVCMNRWRKSKIDKSGSRRRTPAIRDGFRPNMYTCGITNDASKVAALHPVPKWAKTRSSESPCSPLSSAAPSPLRRTSSSTSSSPLSPNGSLGPIARTRSFFSPERQLRPHCQDTVMTPKATPEGIKTPRNPTPLRIVHDVFEIARDAAAGVAAAGVARFVRTPSQDTALDEDCVPSNNDDTVLPSPFGRSVLPSPFGRSSSLGSAPSVAGSALGRTPSDDGFGRTPSIGRAESVASIDMAFYSVLGQSNLSNFNRETRRKWYVNYSGRRVMIKKADATVVVPRNPADSFIRNFRKILLWVALIVFSPQIGGAAICLFFSVGCTRLMILASMRFQWLTCDFAKRVVLWTIQAGIFLAFIFHIAGVTVFFTAASTVCVLLIRNFERFEAQRHMYFCSSTHKWISISSQADSCDGSPTSSPVGRSPVNFNEEDNAVLEQHLHPPPPALLAAVTEGTLSERRRRKIENRDDLLRELAQERRM